MTDIREQLRAHDARVGSPVCLAAADKIDRLILALEWALDQAGSDHPHYPERVLPRTAYAVWQFPYLVSGTPFGGGVGHATFESALDAVEHAQLETRA